VLPLAVYLDFPLDKGVGIWVAVDAEEEEPLALFVVAVVGVKNLKEDRHAQIERERVMQTREWLPFLRRLSGTHKKNEKNRQCLSSHTREKKISHTSVH